MNDAAIDDGGNMSRSGTLLGHGNHFFNPMAQMRTQSVKFKRPGGREMLSSVVDQCLSMALTSVGRKMSAIGKSGAIRRQPWQTPLAAYPRLAAALERAEADGVLPRNRALRAFH